MLLGNKEKLSLSKFKKPKEFVPKIYENRKGKKINDLQNKGQ